MLIGFCIGFLSLKFLSIDVSLYSHFSFKPENELFVLGAILSIPLFDMFRVIGVRLLQGKSPFYPDRNHAHHILIDLGLSHFSVTMMLGFVNYAFVIGVIKLSGVLSSFLMLGVLLLLFGLFIVVFNELKKKIVLSKVLS